MCVKNTRATYKSSLGRVSGYPFGSQRGHEKNEQFYQILRT